MTHTIYKTCTIKCLFIKNFIKICTDFFFIIPILAVSFYISEHFLNLKVSTTMLRTFKGSD